MSQYVSLCPCVSNSVAEHASYATAPMLSENDRCYDNNDLAYPSSQPLQRPISAGFSPSWIRA